MIALRFPVHRVAYAWGNAVLQPTLTEPSNVVPPSLAGVVEMGDILTVYAGVWSGVPQPVITYQWQRNGDPILDQTTTQIILASPIVPGDEITCIVTATNSVDTVSVTTAPKIIPNPQNPDGLLTGDGDPILTGDGVQIIL